MMTINFLHPHKPSVFFAEKCTTRRFFTAVAHALLSLPSDTHKRRQTSLTLTQAPAKKGFDAANATPSCFKCSGVRTVGGNLSNSGGKGELGVAKALLSGGWAPA